MDRPWPPRSVSTVRWRPPDPGWYKGFPLEAKLAAGLWAIRHAHRLGWRSLWVESDSILVVKALLTSQSSLSSRLHGLWDSVKHLRSDKNIKVTHIFREGNQATDIVVIAGSCIWTCPWIFLVLFDVS